MSESNTPSDEVLASKAKTGDKAAFDVLCDRYLSAVYNRLRALLPPEAVEDVSQEVFIAAFKGIKGYREQSLFRTWISAITRHKVADYYRKQSRRPETIPLEAKIDTMADPAGWGEDKAMVRLALYRLPAHYQEILLLRFAEGMPFDQIAEALEISLEATKSRYRRAVAAVAQQMKVDGVDDVA